MKRGCRTCALLFLLAVMGSGASPATEFAVGDLYLITTAHPDPAIDTGLIRIVPETGAVITLGEVDVYAGNLSYDPYRDRLIGSNGIERFDMLDATGSATPFPAEIPAPFLVAPRGDGILYAFYILGNFGYIDAANVFHDLLNESGSGPYGLGSDADPTGLCYDHTTNSLLVFDGTGSDIAECADPTRSCVLKIPLTPDGTQVAAAVTAIQVDISTTGEIVVGAVRGPGTSVLWVVDTNSNGQEPRLQLLEPGTMVSAPYAANGPYTGAASTNAGAYCTRLDQAVVLDTFNNALRAFSYGDAGAGVVIADSVSDPGGSGETARLVEIRASPFPSGVGPTTPDRDLFLAAFPNPFNPVTTISFELPTAGQVRLTICDVAGHRIRTLVDDGVQRGIHEAVWDGRDTSGREVGSGTYLARLEFGGKVEAVRMGLIR